MSFLCCSRAWNKPCYVWREDDCACRRTISRILHLACHLGRTRSRLADTAWLRPTGTMPASEICAACQAASPLMKPLLLDLFAALNQENQHYNKKNTANNANDRATVHGKPSFFQLKFICHPEPQK